MKICEAKRKGGGTAASPRLKRKQFTPPGALGGGEEEEEGEEGERATSSSSSATLPERSRVLQPWPKSKEAPPLLLTSEGWSAWEWRPVEV